MHAAVSSLREGPEAPEGPSAEVDFVLVRQIAFRIVRQGFQKAVLVSTCEVLKIYVRHFFGNAIFYRPLLLFF